VSIGRPPWKASAYDPLRGYDCMTGAIPVEDANRKTIFVVDLAEFDQGHCVEPSPEMLARAVAVASLAADAPALLAALGIALASARDAPTNRPTPPWVTMARALTEKHKGFSA
jgi:hypothetical protein